MLWPLVALYFQSLSHVCEFKFLTDPQGNIYSLVKNFWEFPPCTPSDSSVLLLFLLSVLCLFPPSRHPPCILPPSPYPLLRSSSPCVLLSSVQLLGNPGRQQDLELTGEMRGRKRRNGMTSDLCVCMCVCLRACVWLHTHVFFSQEPLIWLSLSSVVYVCVCFAMNAYCMCASVCFVYVVKTRAESVTDKYRERGSMLCIVVSHRWMGYLPKKLALFPWKRCEDNKQ